MRIGSILPILLISLIAFSQIQGQYSQSTTLPNTSVGLSGSRDIPLTIKLVFLGLANSDVDPAYLGSGINLPGVKYQTILAGPLNTGVTFRFSYQIVFANSSMVSKFVSYLNSIAITQTSRPADPSFANSYFDNSTTQIQSVANTFYDANRVEGWLLSALDDFGERPVPGYTLFIADLHKFPEIPSFSYQEYQYYTTRCALDPSAKKCLDQTRTAHAHYYNRTVTDPDLALVLTRHYMTAWGGSERFYFIDLSAGPSYWTDQLPVQVAAGLRGVDLASSYGKTWTSQFIADYLFGAVYNLFAADQVYPVNYSEKYNFHLFIFDNRTAREKGNGPRLTDTIRSQLIQSQLASLLPPAPYSNVTVNVRFANVTDYPDLARVMANATTNLKDPAVGTPIVDARPVYNWLSKNSQGQISQFINVTRNSLEYDIPAFIFAFQGDYNFGFTFKEEVFLPSSRGSIFGVALGDLVLISHGQSDLTAGDSMRFLQPGRGVGFTATVLHELGHMLGLNHPFIYDITEDFTNSVMGYYPYSLTFSRFDRDTLLRGVNDQLLIFAQVTLANTTATFFNSRQISAARQAMVSADQKYGQMAYEEAVPYSRSAALNALAAHRLANAGPLIFLSPSLMLGVLGLVIGATVGVLAGFLLFRRRAGYGIQYNRCPDCQQPLRWDPLQVRWYCDRCRKPGQL